MPNKINHKVSALLPLPNAPPVPGTNEPPSVSAEHYSPENHPSIARGEFKIVNKAGDESFHFASGGNAEFPSSVPGDHPIVGTRAHANDPKIKGRIWDIEDSYDPMLKRERKNVLIHQSTHPGDNTKNKSHGCFSIAQSDWDKASPAIAAKIDEINKAGGKPGVRFYADGNAELLDLNIPENKKDLVATNPLTPKDVVEAAKGDKTPLEVKTESGPVSAANKTIIPNDKNDKMAGGESDKENKVVSADSDKSSKDKKENKGKGVSLSGDVSPEDMFDKPIDEPIKTYPHIGENIEDRRDPNVKDETEISKKNKLVALYKAGRFAKDEKHFHTHEKQIKADYNKTHKATADNMTKDIDAVIASIEKKPSLKELASRSRSRPDDDGMSSLDHLKSTPDTAPTPADATKAQPNAQKEENKAPPEKSDKEVKPEKVSYRRQSDQSYNHEDHTYPYDPMAL